MFMSTNFPPEQLAEFRSRTLTIRLSYEDVIALGMALCIEREHLLEYMMNGGDDDTIRLRLKTIGGAISAAKAGVMAVWPELCQEIEQRRKPDHARADAARVKAAELLSQLTGRPVSPEDIGAVDDADLANFSPTAGHG